MTDAGPHTGSVESFRRFFGSEQDELVRFCWGLTLDHDDAHEVAQETMSRAWRDWDRVSAEGSNPAAWCRTVALNLVRGMWRRQQTARLGRGAIETQVLVERARHADVETRRDLDLEQALAGLPQRQREAVVLHHLMDLPVRECAAVMDVGVSSVKVHLRRGRDSLARQLGVEPGPAGEDRVTGPTGQNASVQNATDEEVPR